MAVQEVLLKVISCKKMWFLVLLGGEWDIICLLLVWLKKEVLSLILGGLL